MIVLRPFFFVSYTVSNCRRRPENRVPNRLRSFTIRWNTAVIRKLPNESNTIKNSRLRPRLIDLGATIIITKTQLEFLFNCNSELIIIENIIHLQWRSLVLYNGQVTYMHWCITQLLLFTACWNRFIKWQQIHGNLQM